MIGYHRYVLELRLFQNLGVAAENDLVPKVASMRPLGNSSPGFVNE